MPLPAGEHVLALLRRRKRLVLRFVAASLARTALAMASVLLIQEFLVGVLGGQAGLARSLAQATGPSTALWAVAALLVVSYAGASWLLYDSQVVRQRIVKIVELGLMERLVRHLLTLSVPFFDRQSQGDFIQAIRQDVSHLRHVVMACGTLLMEGAVGLGLAASAIWISPRLAFWVLGVMLLAFLPIVAIGSRTRVRSLAVRRKGYLLFDVILQILRGLRVIKAYRGEELEAGAAVEKARRYFDEQIRMTQVHEKARVVLESLAGVSLAAVVIIGGFQVMAGALEWPGLLAFLMAVRTLQGPIHEVNANFMEIQRYSAAAQRISELLAERPEVKESPDAVALTRPPRRITLDRVCFSYGDRTVLDDVSLEIEAGETIGVAGPSGAGKTTLLGLVARFYEPTSGAVRFDGQDLRRFRLADVYDQLAIVTQEPFLFTASVRDNIRRGRPAASDAEVEAAAKVAEVHEEILELPEGYDTVVGIGGRGVSGGQAQRINVARALLKNAPILLLDEATSHLDSIAEAKVQRTIEKLMRGRTTLLVAHRLSSLRHAERILVLERGRCVGLGSHPALLADCPLYRRMWETQRLGLEAASPPAVLAPPKREPSEEAELEEDEGLID
jgi:ABC-type multidrug transport system fused ATPase/permease subunit